MRILFVTWDGPQVNYLESLFLPIFRELRPRGFDFDILQFRWGNPGQRQAIAQACADDGFGYRAVNIWRWGGAAGPFASALVGGLHVRRAMRAFGTEAVMPRSVLPSLAVLAGRCADVKPVLFDSDGLEVDERVEFGGMQSTSLAYRILRDVEAQMVRRSTSVLVRTPFGRDVLMVRAGPHARAEAFHQVSNGRDETVFHPFDDARRGAVRAELGIPPEVPLLLYVGSVGGKYLTARIGQFAQEVRKLRPDTRLVVLTGSPELAAAELFGPLPDLQGSTLILRADPADVPRYIAAADIGTAFIRPTFSMRSVAPVKTGEYLLCGVPVVGCAEVGDNRAGLERGVFFDDRRGLEAAAAWVADEVLPNREAYREKARSVGAAEFSLTRSVSAYLAALEAIRSGREERLDP